MPFKPPVEKDATPSSPEALFSSLPRTGLEHATLWVHQGDVLRIFHDRFANEGDVAIELPTGTGKTLPGLLIADWNRRFHEERVVYACPTVQLVAQVLRAAKKQGIPAVDLSGTWREWDAQAKIAFERGAAVAVTTYAAIFNSNPHLTDVGSIVLDDAHAPCVSGLGESTGS